VCVQLKQPPLAEISNEVSPRPCVLALYPLRLRLKYFLNQRTMTLSFTKTLCSFVPSGLRGHLPE